MCLIEGDNVATRNLRSSAETLHASISPEQLGLLQTVKYPSQSYAEAGPCTGPHVK